MPGTWNSNQIIKNFDFRYVYFLDNATKDVILSAEPIPVGLCLEPEEEDSEALAEEEDKDVLIGGAA
jgi:hypothetical protein